MAIANASGQFPQQFLVAQSGCLLRRDWLTNRQRNLSQTGQKSVSRPCLIRSVDADRNQWHAAAPRDGDETGLERRDSAVVRPRAFGKNEHEFPCFQPPE